MNISIKHVSQNLSFNARYTKVSKMNMNSILLPLLEDKNIDMRSLAELSGFSNPAICAWFMEEKGISAAKFFKQRQEQKLGKELLELHQNGATEEEIAKHYKRNWAWAHAKLVKHGIKDARANINKRLETAGRAMVEAGFPISVIAKEVKCSYRKAQEWLKEDIAEGIVQYRHNKKIKLDHGDSSKYIDKKNSIAQLFAEGKSITEVAQIKGLSITQIRNLKMFYDLKTEKDIAHERMVELVPGYIQAKKSLKFMAQEIGKISTETIRRYIKKLTGKTYREILSEKINQITSK